MANTLRSLYNAARSHARRAQLPRSTPRKVLALAIARRLYETGRVSYEAAVGFASVHADTRGECAARALLT